MVEVTLLQEFIYRRLNTDQELMSRAKGIFTHVPENFNFPYIHINNIRVKNAGSKTHKGANVTINIAIYDQQNSYKQLMWIIKSVTKLLEVSQFQDGFLNIMQLSLSEMEYSQKNDGVTNQLHAKFMANIYNGDKE